VASLAAISFLEGRPRLAFFGEPSALVSFFALLSVAFLGFAGLTLVGLSFEIAPPAPEALRSAIFFLI